MNSRFRSLLREQEAACQTTDDLLGLLRRVSSCPRSNNLPSYQCGCSERASLARKIASALRGTIAAATTSAEAAGISVSSVYGDDVRDVFQDLAKFRAGRIDELQGKEEVSRIRAALTHA